ncbi:aldolase/citrate lyase family protein [Solwaraspora sp. WMMD792]|uniref:HpcH/HpaI aldolase family protein n=1 Tax=Solwaraspora sp. WMMD792 TaxID=3016099 RepID=UPI002416005F|nr:aldolase/citrate lyase family protein [Solwaraspora sp. WMMD792]MDG4772459.1 aldolase/citrate lyase family protein [Solwaraspora sp. WMMD792]
MRTGVHTGRAALRERLRRGRRVVGTFLKLPGTDAVELAAQAGLDFVVVDLEHSGLDERTAAGQLRHAALLGLPALVRLAAVDPAQVNRLLEAGAAGVQLSTVRARAQLAALYTAVRYAPTGRRSISLAHPAAGYGSAGLDAYLAAEAADPPLLVAQIETADTDDPLPDLLTGVAGTLGAVSRPGVAGTASVDVAFAGTTDLAVSLGLATTDDQAPLLRRVGEIADAARAAGVTLGGWAPGRADGILRRYGLTGANYLVAGSDLQLLGAGLRHLATDN